MSFWAFTIGVSFLIALVMWVLLEWVAANPEIQIEKDEEQEGKNEEEEENKEEVKKQNTSSSKKKKKSKVKKEAQD